MHGLQTWPRSAWAKSKRCAERCWPAAACHDSNSADRDARRPRDSRPGAVRSSPRRRSCRASLSTRILHQERVRFLEQLLVRRPLQLRHLQHRVLSPCGARRHQGGLARRGGDLDGGVRDRPRASVGRTQRAGRSCVRRRLAADPYLGRVALPRRNGLRDLCDPRRAGAKVLALHTARPRDVVYEPARAPLPRTLAGGAAIANRGSWRRLARFAVPVALCAAIEGMLVVLFPSSGRFPFSFAELVPVVAFCVVGLAATWRLEQGKPLAGFFALTWSQSSSRSPFRRRSARTSDGCDTSRSRSRCWSARSGSGGRAV